MIEKFLTTEQVANILQVHPFTILRLIKSGKLKGVKLGRVYRIKEADVQEFLERSSTKESEKKEKRKEPAKKMPKKEENIIYKGSDDDDEDDEETKEKHYYLI